MWSWCTFKSFSRLWEGGDWIFDWFESNISLWKQWIFSERTLGYQFYSKTSRWIERLCSLSLRYYYSAKTSYPLEMSVPDIFLQEKKSMATTFNKTPSNRESLNMGWVENCAKLEEAKNWSGDFLFWVLGGIFKWRRNCAEIGKICLPPSPIVAHSKYQPENCAAAAGNVGNIEIGGGQKCKRLSSMPVFALSTLTLFSAWVGAKNAPLSLFCLFLRKIYWKSSHISKFYNYDLNLCIFFPVEVFRCASIS